MVIILCYVVLVVLLYLFQSVDLYGICIYIYICILRKSSSKPEPQHLLDANNH